MAGRVADTIIRFWCARCRVDWKILARRYRKNRRVGEVWSAKCPDCQQELVRLINNPTDDPYYRLSKKVHSDLKKFSKDVIQPNDPRFDVLYPKHREEREQKEDEKLRRAWNTKHK